VIDPISTPGASASIMSITLQATDGITISNDSNGVVRIWDISTGQCNGSFQTPAKDPEHSDVRLINNRLIYVWYLRKKIYIEDVESGELQIVDTTEGNIKCIKVQDGKGDNHVYPDIQDDKDDNRVFSGVYDVKISGDGCRVFCLQWGFIQAWSTLTGEDVGQADLMCDGKPGLLTVDGSRVWAHSGTMEPQPEGWNFGTMGSPVQLSNVPPPNGTKQWDIWRYRITDTATGKVVFYLTGRFGNPCCSQWDGQYLVAGYKPGEVLILDFNHIFPLY